MLYKIEIGDREIYLAQKAFTDDGDYIVYEWNDGLYLDDEEDEDDYIDDDMEEELFPIDYGVDDNDEEDDDEDLDEDEDDDNEEFDEEYEEGEEEKEVRLDIEALLSSGFVPQGGVSTYITPKYTTVYTQAFFRKKK